jgi:hypothetical protein
LATEILGLFFVDPIKSLRRLRLQFDIHDLWRSTLHAESELIRFDRAFDLGIGAAPFKVLAVQPLKELDLFWIHPSIVGLVGRFEIGDSARAKSSISADNGRLVNRG